MCIFYFALYHSVGMKCISFVGTKITDTFFSVLFKGNYCCFVICLYEMHRVGVIWKAGFSEIDILAF